MIRSIKRGDTEETWVLEGSLKDNSLTGKFNALVDASYKTPWNEVTLSSNVYADRENAKVDFSTNFYGQQFTLKIEGTRTSIIVDANIYKHILLNAYVSGK